MIEQSIMILLAHINKKLPDPIASMFRYCTPTNRRISQHFAVPFASTNYRSFALSCSAPKIWNTVIGKMYRNLDEVPKSKEVLKKRVRAYLLDTYCDTGA